MDDGYSELVNRAIKGNKTALDDLFDLAKAHEAKHDMEGATWAFREAAIAYRITAFRNLARAEEAEARVKWMEQVVGIHRAWIEANPAGMPQLPRTKGSVDRECIWRIVPQELAREPDFAPAFRYLFETLSSLGMEFYSPGGSLVRCVSGLVESAFGFESNGFAHYLEDRSVRIGVDLLADEVERRCSATPSSPQAGVRASDGTSELPCT
jgi:hypothetical protein